MNRSQYYIMQKKHEDYLMHHGIDGQKWGVKHGPPYPLDDSKSTGSKLKTKKKKKKKELDPGEKAAIERGGRFGLIGATVADLKYRHDKKKKKEAEKSKPKETEKPVSNSIEDKLKRAKNEDKWEIDFLERYDTGDDWNADQALREYKKYLNNPSGYHRS